MTDKQDNLGRVIDSIDNLAHGLALPMPADFHIKQLKELLPEKVQGLKDAFVELTGENPWEF